MNSKTLSAQMLAVLRLLDCESLTVRQLNDRLYDPTSSRSRRVFAASMSRTIHRMERRRLISYESGAIAITSHGWFTLHPEELEAKLAEIAESARKTVRQMFSEDQEWRQFIAKFSDVDATPPSEM